MNLKNLHRTFLLLFSVLLFSCGEYHKVLKSNDLGLQYKTAEELYNKQDYARAEKIFEKILPNYIGKPQGERLLYMYADCFYQRQKYLLAAEQFERMVKNYPKSEKAPEAVFLVGKSYFMETPKYSLDQSETYRALDKLQDFIDRYPNSLYLREANNMVLELVNKLQYKSLEIAIGYDKIRDYQAALKSLDNFLIENPGSVFKEKAMYYKLHSAYELAANSVASKEK